MLDLRNRETNPKVNEKKSYSHCITAGWESNWSE